MTRNGFTLIELLVALSAASLLFLGLATVLSGTVQRYERSDAGAASAELETVMALERFLDRVRTPAAGQPGASCADNGFSAPVDQPLALDPQDQATGRLVVKSEGDLSPLELQIQTAEGRLASSTLPLKFDSVSISCERRSNPQQGEYIAAVAVSLRVDNGDATRIWLFDIPASASTECDASVGGDTACRQ